MNDSDELDHWLDVLVDAYDKLNKPLSERLQLMAINQSKDNFRKLHNATDKAKRLYEMKWKL